MYEIMKESRSILQTTPAYWLRLAQSLSNELFNRLPAPGEWGAMGCLQHLVETEQLVFPVRVKLLLAGKDFPTYHPDEAAVQATSPAALAAEFNALRAESLKLFEQITPANLARQARHQELGMVTLSQLLHEWAGHDLMHTVQAERALMQPFIEGCGPWQVYFQDHVIKGK